MPPRTTEHCRSTTVVAAMLVAVCSACAPGSSEVAGYRMLPQVCALVDPELVEEHLGDAVEVRARATVPVNPDLSRGRTSASCEWETAAPPQWGGTGRATIDVTVTIAVLEDGAPDIELVERGARFEAEQGRGEPLEADLR